MRPRVRPFASRGSGSGLLPLALPLAASGFGPASRSVACGIRLGSLPRPIGARGRPSLGLGPPPLGSLRRVGRGGSPSSARSLGLPLALFRAPCSVALFPLGLGLALSALGLFGGPPSSPCGLRPCGACPRSSRSGRLVASPSARLPFSRRRPLAFAAPAALLPAEGVFSCLLRAFLGYFCALPWARGPSPRVVAVKGRAVAPAGPLDGLRPCGETVGKAARSRPLPKWAVLQGGRGDPAKCLLTE